jgi:uncharacterized caspase-like protein
MRPIANLVAALVLAVATAATAQAKNHFALVIGNDLYPNLPADRQLAKAVNDARAVGTTLEKLGFKVTRGENLNRTQMVDHIFNFTQSIKEGDTAILFFAGHGVAIAGGNYLLPIDIPMPRQGEEGRVRNIALSETDIVAEIQERKARVAIMILDACRDNPFRQPGLTRSIGGESGLTRAREAEGVFSIYSAGFGQTALDRLSDTDTSPNSVFTRTLLPALARTDTHLAEIVIDMREEVARLAASVDHRQYPAYYDQTRGGRVFLASAPATKPASKKAALLIGINKYKEPLSSLKNAINDVTAVANMLRASDYNVVRIEADVTRDQLIRGLTEFAAFADGADTAIIYYAGQGFAREHNRYLLTSDTKADRVFTDAIDIDLLQSAIPRSVRQKLIVLDTCQYVLRANEQTKEMPPTATWNAPILYSTSNGEPSFDGDGDLGPFASAFLKHFGVANRTIRDAFQLIREDVRDQTKSQQTPSLHGQIPDRASLITR